MSHNSSQEEEEDDSMSFHMTSMFHETLDETKATLYEYLLDDEDEIGSLPELDSCSGSTHSMPRSGFGWTPSPRRRISNSTSTGTSSNLQPCLQQSQQQQQQRDLQEKLQLAQKELTEVRHANARLVQNQKGQEQELSDALRQLQDECRLLKARLELDNHEKQELIRKLRQRDLDLEELQIQMDCQRDLLEANNVDLNNLRMEQSRQESNDCRNIDRGEHSYQVNDFVLSFDEENEELQAKIDECERELQQFGVALNSNQNHVPREIHTRPTVENPPPTTTNNMVHHSMRLAQSLIGLFKNKEEDEDQVMDQLGFMSQLLHHEDDGGAVIVFPDELLIPFQVYQRLAKKCHQLESERSLVICENLKLIESVREGYLLEMKIKEKELKASFQNKLEKCVSHIISGRECSDLAAPLLATLDCQWMEGQDSSKLD
jgi:hypothetical protein